MGVVKDDLEYGDGAQALDIGPKSPVRRVMS